MMSFVKRLSIIVAVMMTLFLLVTEKDSNMSGQPLIRFARRDGGYDYVDARTKKLVRRDPGQRRELPPDESWAKDAGRAAKETPEAEAVATMRPLAGARLNNRGNAQLFEIGGNASLEEQLITTFVETPKSAGDDGELISVTLGMQYQQEVDDIYSAVAGPPDSLTSYFNPVAVLEWGLGGATFQAEVDWSVGNRFALCASYVRVGLRIPSVSLTADPFNVIFSASLGYGQEPKKARLTRDTQLDMSQLIAVAGASDYVAIPPFAESFVLAPRTLTTSAAFQPFRIHLSDGTVYEQTLLTNAGRLDQETFPIPNGARTLYVTNIGAANAKAPRVIFSLAL